MSSSFPDDREKLFSDFSDIKKSYDLRDKLIIEGEYDGLPACCICMVPFGTPPFVHKPASFTACLSCTDKLWINHLKDDKGKPFLDPVKRIECYMCSCGDPIITLSGPLTHLSLFWHAMKKCDVDISGYKKYIATHYSP